MSSLNGATLQKIRNGQKTFAVTPSLPAGFIKPDQMRKYAEVAEKYGLTLKITSGQRIMMIGMKEEQVELVWQDLGMNPAFSSPTCVRSVKVCPGTTFCKRGRQDSVKLGLKLDEIYRGMEMPHKMKMGISGCPNSCSESIVRDIGIVGHNEGWRVYVGGSAGGKPRIGDLLTEGLNDDEVLALVDLIIQYYKKNGVLERLGDLIDRIGFSTFQATLMTAFTGQMFVPVTKKDEVEPLPFTNQHVTLEKKQTQLPLSGTSIIGDLILDYPESIEVLRSFGMGCLGCNAAATEPIAQACEIHGMKLEPLLDKLNELLMKDGV